MPGTEQLQDEVYELMRRRLADLFGPGGSFRITLGRPTGDDAVFVETVADTIAWDVAAAIDTERHAAPRRLADQVDEDEHRAIWQYVEAELLRRRTAEHSIPTAVVAA